MKNKEFKSFYKVVGGGEGDRCNYPVRLDTYGCGCQHDCSYCYAKTLLDFRNLWDNKNPSIADVEKVKRKIKKLPKGQVVRLGGMTDCFQPLEKSSRNTYKTIECLNECGVPYLIVTKSHIVADDEYIELMDKNLAHIQISLSSTDDEIAKTYEKASLPSQRIAAIEKLQAHGFDVQVRLAPFIPEFVDVNIINNIKCDKILVEFLRVNHYVQKWFDIDYSKYTLKEGGYRHLPLEVKLEHINKIKGNFKERTVCEDYTEHYEYWKQNYNSNKNDCCNLKLSTEI